MGSKTAEVKRKLKARFPDLIQEVCDEEKITLSVPFGDALYILRKNGKEAHIWGRKFGLNPSIAAYVADDKVGTSAVLLHHNVPNVQHTFVRAPRDKKDRSWQAAQDFLQRYTPQGIVVKPVIGHGGDFVYRVNTKRQLRQVLFKKSLPGSHLAFSPFEEIRHEYRAIVLNNKALYLFDKVIDKATQGKEWRHNLNRGTRFEIVNDPKVRAKLRKLAVQSSKAVGLRFGSIDMIENTAGELKVIEINSGATDIVNKKSIVEYEVLKESYRAAIKEMFRQAESSK